jgi:Tfp pilus assembly protein PilN
MINLLPPEHKQRNRIASLSYLIALVYIIVGVVVFVGAAALATYNLTASADIAGKEDRIAALSEQKDKNSEIATKANFISDRISSRGTYQESFAWEGTLDSIAKATPSEVRLKGIKSTIDSKSKKVTIILQGISSDRRSVLLFRSKLSEEKMFTAPFIQQLNEIAANTTKEFDFTIELGVQTDAVKK